MEAAQQQHCSQTAEQQQWTSQQEHFMNLAFEQVRRTAAGPAPVAPLDSWHLVVSCWKNTVQAAGSPSTKTKPFVYPFKAKVTVTDSKAFEQLADATYILCLACLQARLALKLREVPIGWVSRLV
jgi:hypothetical protein